MGIEQHIKSMEVLFVYAPDTRIEDHLVRMGSSSATASRAVALASGGTSIEEVAVGPGQWTCVIGIMKGSFTEPMPMPDGHTRLPTGQSFVLSMCTVGRWMNGMSQIGTSK